jgi:membrane protein YqaA with SNARE-associated domain
MGELAVYFGLFLTALAAATILPMQSEAVLVGLLLYEDYPASLLIAVASVGNILGSVMNWLLGRGVERFRDRRWFPVGPSALDRAQRWYRRYGKWSLLASWCRSSVIRSPWSPACFGNLSRHFCCWWPSPRLGAIWFLWQLRRA